MLNFYYLGLKGCGGSFKEGKPAVPFFLFAEKIFRLNQKLKYWNEVVSEKTFLQEKGLRFSRSDSFIRYR